MSSGRVAASLRAAASHRAAAQKAEALASSVRASFNLMVASVHSAEGRLQLADASCAGPVPTCVGSVPRARLHAAGGPPNSRRNARLKAVSVWYPTASAIAASEALPRLKRFDASSIRH